MGKVKDGTAASKLPKPSKGGTASGAKNRFGQFLLNLVRTDLYKPMQGWHARLYTALGVGLIAAVGVWRLLDVMTESSIGFRYGVPAGVALLIGWFLFRLVHYPPFAEFLIATEAEMNKVSWTHKEDLYRATIVVLVTVVLVSVFLFGVDWIWSNLLQALGVLRFGGGGAFGSTA